MLVSGLLAFLEILKKYYYTLGYSELVLRFLLLIHSNVEKTPIPICNAKMSSIFLVNECLNFSGHPRITIIENFSCE